MKPGERPLYKCDISRCHERAVAIAPRHNKHALHLCAKHLAQRDTRLRNATEVLKPTAGMPMEIERITAQENEFVAGIITRNISFSEKVDALDELLYLYL